MSETAAEPKPQDVIIRQDVHIVGINVSTRDIFFFMLQIALASIPVVVIFGLLGYYAFVFLAAIAGYHSPSAVAPL